jgi:hypothetical protein
MNIFSNLPVNPVPVTTPEKVVWIGAGGTRYEFQKHRIGTAYHAYAGVYIFCRDMPLVIQAIYIGETDNFSRRLTNELALHHQWQSVVAAGATHICTMRVLGDNAARVRIETDLRHRYNPSCNRQ